MARRWLALAPQTTGFGAHSRYKGGLSTPGQGSTRPPLVTTMTNLVRQRHPGTSLRGAFPLIFDWTYTATRSSPDATKIRKSDSLLPPPFWRDPPSQTPSCPIMSLEVCQRLSSSCSFSFSIFFCPNGLPVDAIAMHLPIRVNRGLSTRHPPARCCYSRAM